MPGNAVRSSVEKLCFTAGLTPASWHPAQHHFRVPTHAGYSGMREALTAGVPTVCLPLFADQPRNAARIQDLKAAESFAAEMAELPVFADIPDHLVSAV